MKLPNRSLLFLFLFVLAVFPTRLLAANAIPVQGCVVIALDDPLSWPDDAGVEGRWKTGDSDLNAWLTSIGATSLRQEYGRLLPKYRVLRFSKDIPNEIVVKYLETRNDIEAAYGNIAFPLCEFTYTPNDPQLPAQWHLETINASRGWALSTGSRDVVIGIVDSGVNTQHPDLASSMWINDSEDINGDGFWDPVVDADGIDNDDNGYVDDGIGWDWVDVSENEVFPGEDFEMPDNDPSDFNGHGTHCAGDAAATTGNGVGVASPGAGCRIGALRAGWSIRTGFGVIGTSEATSAIAYAVENGFSIISMSFGSEARDPAYFIEGMVAARDAGLILVAAAGNEGSTARHYPAGESFVIGVAATNPQNNLTEFSNRGSWVTVSAPGDFIYSTLNGGYYGAMSGTSMACPVMAGALASLKSIAPSWTYDQYMTRLTLSCTPLTDTGAGAGLLNLAGLLDPFVSVDSIAIESASGAFLVHDEPATLHLAISKYDGFATNVEMTLTSENPRVVLPEEAIQVGGVVGGVQTLQDVSIEVESGVLSREEVQIQIHFTGEDAFVGEFAYDQTLRLQVGRGDLLLIDADEGGNDRLDLWYSVPLNNLGLQADIVKLGDINDLSVQLSGYTTAILATGRREATPFRDGELRVWADFVENGGQWLLTGQNVAESMLADSPEALDTLLHVGFTAAHSNRLTIRGIENAVLSEGVYFVLAGDGGAWNQTSLDVIEAHEGAEPLFVYTHDNPEELAGVRTQRGTGEIVFCSFGLEAVNDSVSTSTTRYDWFSRLLRSWGYELGMEDEGHESSTPSDFVLGRAWPNPTNGTVTVSFSLPTAGEVGVKVVNLVGREVARWKQVGKSGENHLSWKMPDHLSSGVYLFAMTAGQTTKTRRIVLIK